MSKEIQIQEAVEKAHKNVGLLATLPDDELAEKLDSVHIQMALAEEKKNTAALELLEIWRSQIIEARIYKAENKIADAPNEIELAIADIETVITHTEERTEILKKFSKPVQQARPPAQLQDTESQLSLF